MKVQLVTVPGGVSLRDTDAPDPEQCRVIGKIYLHSDAWGIERACNAHEQLVAALLHSESELHARLPHSTAIAEVRAALKAVGIEPQHKTVSMPALAAPGAAKN